MKIVINDQQIEVEGIKTILEAARENNIYIPSLCDHPYLKPFSGCRLCIVEIKGRRGFPPSCGTYVEEGMEIKTETPQLQKMRRQILELILSEHPHACLICSEKENCDEYKSTIRKVGETTGCVLCANNGRCELQDVVEALKIDRVNFPALYRNYEVKREDPFFDRNYNLCILCGRCARVCHEIRGASALSFVFRGSKAVVGTVLDRPLLESGCQFCGACLDVCPTGALTERGIKYELLPDESTTTICALCALGCELKVDLRKDRILSLKPLEEGKVNRGQACVKGRFTLKELVYSSERLLKPLIRKKKDLEEVSWSEALDFVVQKLKAYKGEEIGIISSSQLTLEDGYLLYKFGQKVLETGNISGADGQSPLELYRRLAKEKDLLVDIDFKLEAISKAKVIFIANEDIVSSYPIVWLEILKAVKRGAKLVLATSVEVPWGRFSSVLLSPKPGAEFYLLSFLSKYCLEKSEAKFLSGLENFDSFRKLLDKLEVSKVYELTGIKKEVLKEASRLLQQNPPVFLFGPGLSMTAEGQQNLEALWNLALLTKGRLMPLSLDCNQRGMIEVENHFSSAFNVEPPVFTQLADSKIKALYAVGSIPHFKDRKPEFLVVQDSFLSEKASKADVILPAATFLEREGTLVNTEGRIQKLNKVINPLGEAKPDWWIISQIAQGMGSKEFGYKKAASVMKEIQQAISALAKASYARLTRGKEIFVSTQAQGQKKFLPSRILPSPVKPDKKYPYLLIFNYNSDHYRSFILSQQIKGLRKIRDSRWVEISPQDAEHLNLNDEQTIIVKSLNGQFRGIVKISNSIPPGLLRASFLPNQDSEYSSFALFSSGKDQPSLGPVAVKILRGR